MGPLRQLLYDMSKSREERGEPLSERDRRRLDPSRPDNRFDGYSAVFEYDKLQREKEERAERERLFEAMAKQMGYTEPEEDDGGYSPAASASDPMEAMGGMRSRSAPDVAPLSEPRPTRAQEPQGMGLDMSGFRMAQQRQSQAASDTTAGAKQTMAPKPQRPTLADAYFQNEGWKGLPDMALPLMQSKQIGPGLSQWADKNLGSGDKPDVAGQDYINMLSNAGMGGEALGTAKKMVESRYSGANMGSGGGATGARLRFAKENPEIVQGVKAVIQRMRESGDYSEDYLASLDTMANSDPMLTIQTISTKKAGTEEGLIKGRKMIPIESMSTEATTASRENTMRAIQQANPILSKAERESLSDAYQGVQFINVLRNAVDKGNADFFDLTKAGQFKNPEVQNAFAQMVEIVGRGRSGAAISESEWANFGKQILNKNFLLSEGGKDAALKQLDRHLDRFFGAGYMTAGDTDWYSNLQSRIGESRALGDASASSDTDTDSRQDRDAARRDVETTVKYKRVNGKLTRVQ